MLRLPPTGMASATGAVGADASATAKEQMLAFDGLLQQNLATRKELEAWIEEQTKGLMLEKRAHLRQTEDAARQSADAVRRQDQLRQQQQAIAQNCQEHETQISSSQVEIEVLQTEKSKKEPVLRDLYAKNQQQDDKLQHLMHEANVQRGQQEQQLSELHRGLAMYERLGLYFEHTGADRIVVRFTQIDAHDPKRVFSFRIRIHPETDRFVVDECQPHVPVLNQLVDQLNDSGDLSFFIRAMRRQFKILV
ncbi:TPA: hypothetical protein N0F65_011318 [Lagenidium giganteum]|uniref:Kinetochore protein SPC25 n=1 Tax=Lagenidium giganteum TaxID=4803 RepID=A0AAV2YG69_9STRA|nr:TPA: hypothetical protein N0F65_011318 [Lagenidium giganteum]